MALNGIRISVGTASEPIVSKVEETAPEQPLVKAGVGEKCRGKVVNFKPYGFFVETPDGLFGLVHGKNIKGWTWKRRFDKVFPLGTEVDLVVLDVDSETNRRSFSCEMPANLPEIPPPPKPEPLPLTRQEQVAKWSEENPVESMEAYEWLKKELADGPIYGPLTTVLGDKFGVPVPASKWILQFPDFTCYSGHGDNPSDLPAVALASESDNRAYWKRIKVKAEELLENRNRTANDSVNYAEVARQLDAKGYFPGAKWIAAYKATAERLSDGSVDYGAADISEGLVLPLLAELGWDANSEGVKLVRGDGNGFTAVITRSAADGARSSVAVVVAKRGVEFDAQRNVVEQLLGYYNRLNAAGDCRIAWTNGADWVVFSRALLAECIGVIAEHRGEKVLDDFKAGATDRLSRIALPREGTVFKWLAAFADLQRQLGA